MDNPTLKRQAVVLPGRVGGNILDPKIIELANNAHELLGYDHLQNAVVDREEMIREDNPFFYLAKTFTDLDIQPFTEESVRWYEEQERYKAMGFLGKHQLICGMIGFFSWVFAVICFVMGFVQTADDQTFLQNYRYPNFMWFGVTVVFMGLTLWVINFRIKESRWKWLSLELKNYHRPVPESVLIKALEIQKRLPKTLFFVEQLTYTEPNVYTGSWQAFLKVCYGVESYYIEVWDEPRFETKL